MILKYNVNKDEVGKSINYILLNKLNISTRLLNKLIRKQKILLNENICDTREKVNFDDIISIDFNYEEDNLNIIPKKMNLDIIYEDEWLIVVNKPQGIPVHPSRMHYLDSLSNGIKYYFESISLRKKIRPVNRLDMETSGIVIFAKCEYIQECFIKQMNSKIFEKEYLCIVNGIIENKNGTISMPISRKKDSIIERCIDEIDGQPSVTHYNVIKEFETYSLVKCKLETGRTHQIRVHMASIGHPILGDTLYGKQTKLIKRQALHSYRIKCIHPVFKNELIFENKLPEDMQNLVKL